MHFVSSMKVVLDYCKGMFCGLYAHSEFSIVASSMGSVLEGSSIGCGKLSHVCESGLGWSIARGRPGHLRGGSPWGPFGLLPMVAGVSLGSVMFPPGGHS